MANKNKTGKSKKNNSVESYSRDHMSQPLDVFDYVNRSTRLLDCSIEDVDHQTNTLPAIFINPNELRAKWINKNEKPFIKFARIADKNHNVVSKISVIFEANEKLVSLNSAIPKSILFLLILVPIVNYSESLMFSTHYSMLIWVILFRIIFSFDQKRRVNYQISSEFDLACAHFSRVMHSVKVLELPSKDIERAHNNILSIMSNYMINWEKQRSMNLSTKQVEAINGVIISKLIDSPAFQLLEESTSSSTKNTIASSNCTAIEEFSDNQSANTNSHDLKEIVSELIEFDSSRRIVANSEEISSDGDHVKTNSEQSEIQGSTVNAVTANFTVVEDSTSSTSNGEVSSERVKNEAAVAVGENVTRDNNTARSTVTATLTKLSNLVEVFDLLGASDKNTITSIVTELHSAVERIRSVEVLDDRKLARLYSKFDNLVVTVDSQLFVIEDSLLDSVGEQMSESQLFFENKFKSL